MQALKARIDASTKNEFAVDLTYITSRGRWYHTSWKGDEAKSGGVATNIGVHFFDMLVHVFGPVASQRRACARATSAPPAISNAGAPRCAGSCRSIAAICRASVAGKQTSYRSIMVDGETVEFSDGFTDLHTSSYQEILAGRGFGLDDGAPVDRDRLGVAHRHAASRSAASRIPCSRR